LFSDYKVNQKRLTSCKVSLIFCSYAHMRARARRLKVLADTNNLLFFIAVR